MIDSRKGAVRGEEMRVANGANASRTFPCQPPSKMNGNATDLSGTKVACPEAKANVAGRGSRIPFVTPRSGGEPGFIARSPRSATFPFTNKEVGSWRS